jgi:hypothetical protein
MKQQLPWEKYLFPTLAVLWTLVSSGRVSRLRVARARSGSARTG